MYILSLLSLLSGPGAAFGLPPETSAPVCTSDSTQPLSSLAPAAIPSVVTEAKGCVLVLELYASWCGPCAKLAPSVKALSETYGGQGLLVRGLSVDTDRERLMKFLETHGGVFAPVVLETWTLAGLGEVFQGMGVHFEASVPLFMVFDREGGLIYQSSEPRDLGEVEAAIKPLL